jgi:hypothetical protein
MVVSGSVERGGTAASPGRQILRGLGWVAFGLCVVDGAIFTIPLPHAGPGYRAHWLPFGALIVVAVGSRIFLWQSKRRGNPKSWVSPLAWRLALLDARQPASEHNDLHGSKSNHLRGSRRLQ